MTGKCLTCGEKMSTNKVSCVKTCKKCGNVVAFTNLQNPPEGTEKAIQNILDIALCRLCNHKGFDRIGREKVKCRNCQKSGSLSMDGDYFSNPFVNEMNI